VKLGKTGDLLVPARARPKASTTAPADAAVSNTTALTRPFLVINPIVNQWGFDPQRYGPQNEFVGLVDNIGQLFTKPDPSQATPQSGGIDAEIGLALAVYGLVGALYKGSILDSSAASVNVLASSLELSGKYWPGAVPLSRELGLVASIASGLLDIGSGLNAEQHPGRPGLATRPA
jgi:hypothetical protein